MVRISDIDILNELRKNSRIPFLKIAKKFKVSEATIRKRVKNLLMKGVIKKFTIEIDYRKIGFQYFVILGIDTYPEGFIKLIEKLKRYENVLDLYTSTGDHMIICNLIFKSSSELNKTIKKLEKNKYVKKVCPAIILEKVK